jgi:hypothetical protein
MRGHLLVVESELLDAKDRLTQIATESGYEVSAIFVEEITTWPAAFERLIHALIRDKVEVVILPSIAHFAVLGPPTMIKEHFEAATLARVVCVTDLVSQSPGEAVS